MMSRKIYRYRFVVGVPFQDVEESLFLAVLAAECLHGRCLVRLDASFCIEERKRCCVIDAGTEVGRSIARIFTGFLSREFGEDTFKVERLDPRDEQKALSTPAAASKADASQPRPAVRETEGGIPAPAKTYQNKG